MILILLIKIISFQKYDFIQDAFYLFLEAYGNDLLEFHLDYLDLNEIKSNSDISKFSAYSSEEEIVFYPFSSFSIEKIYKENGKTKIILECLGKYKDTIKEAINKYKNEFGSFENQISYSNFYNDVQNSKYKIRRLFTSRLY